MDSGSSWVQEKADIYVERAIEGKNDTAPVNFFMAFNGNGGSLSVTGFTLTKRAP